MFKHVAIALSLGVAVSAFGLDSLSGECRVTLTTLIVQPDVKACIALDQLLNIVLVPAGDSIVSASKIWLNQLCKAAECPTEVVSSTATEIISACAGDLAQFGLTLEQVQSFLPYIVDSFAVAKDVACLSNTLDSNFCVPSLMSSIETALSVKLSVNFLFDTIKDSIVNRRFPLPAELACVDCTQAALQIVTSRTEINNVFNLTNFAEETCGVDFVSSEPPVNVLISAGEDAAKKDEPSGVASLKVAGSLLATVAAVAVTLL